MKRQWITFSVSASTKSELDQQFQAALNELTPVLEYICAMTGEEVSDERYDQENSVLLRVLARLLLSRSD